jgi:hypothetical protein
MCRGPADDRASSKQTKGFEVMPGVRHVVLPLPRIKQDIFDMLRRRPATASEILAHVWQLRPQPPKLSVVKAHICQINRLLAPEGLRIRADRERYHRRYRMVTL